MAGLAHPHVLLTVARTRVVERGGSTGGRMESFRTMLHRLPIRLKSTPGAGKTLPRGPGRLGQDACLDRCVSARAHGGDAELADGLRHNPPSLFVSLHDDNLGAVPRVRTLLMGSMRGRVHGISGLSQ